jgi:FtsH-binding integral membrane protein
MKQALTYIAAAILLSIVAGYAFTQEVTLMGTAIGFCAIVVFAALIVSIKVMIDEFSK